MRMREEYYQPSLGIELSDRLNKFISSYFAKYNNNKIEQQMCISENADCSHIYGKPFTKNERIFLKAFLLSRLYKFLCELFQDVIKYDLRGDANLEMEHYTMDSKLIQYTIRSIVQSGEYTLEGIAFYTRIPFDVILDAACGNNCQLSMVSWIRIADLYLQTNPDIYDKLLDKLHANKNKKGLIMSILRNEV